MHILAITNNKGGVGKTTSAQNIGAAIGNFSNSRTLLIDLDPQANLSSSFGIYLKEGNADIGSFLLGKTSLNDSVVTYKDTRIDILASSIELFEQEDKFKKDPMYPFNLQKALAGNKDKYEFVVIDCPPTLSTFTTIALVACHRYYVPIQAEFFSYEGLRKFVDFAHKISSINPRLQLGGVFATRYNPNSRKNLSKELIQTVQEQIQNKFLKTYIRENISLSEAQAKGQHIFEYDVNSNGAQDYYNLTKEIIVR